jgi:hypothetical protein
VEREDLEPSLLLQRFPVEDIVVLVSFAPVSGSVKSLSSSRPPSIDERIMLVRIPAVCRMSITEVPVGV